MADRFRGDWSSMNLGESIGQHFQLLTNSLLWASSVQHDSHQRIERECWETSGKIIQEYRENGTKLINRLEGVL